MKVAYVLKEAKQFIKQCYRELGLSEEKQDKRIQEIEEEIEATGTYKHTKTELVHGAKMAWRNSNRCIGRLVWHTLEVFDARDVTTAEEAYEHLVKHIDFATNDGKIRPTITIFPPKNDRETEAPLRVLNHQLIRYAGYEIEGKVVGDSSSLDLTKTCLELGWKGEGGSFDLLPLVIKEAGQEPKWFPLPEGLVKEVPITHPELKGIDELGLKWYAVPIISDMRLEIGGISYPMAPFNGWYMGTEIGARNFADDYRYNCLPKVAEIMGLDTSNDRTLWRDKAIVELNIAIVHSYSEAGVTLVDHHTAARQFKQFEKLEEEAKRKVTGDWTWLIPPVSPATTHIFHKEYDNTTVTPNYFYQ